MYTENEKERFQFIDLISKSKLNFIIKAFNKIMLNESTVNVEMRKQTIAENRY